MITHAEIKRELKKQKRISSVIIPFYNASAHIEEVICGIPEYIDNIIVIEDGSPEPFKPIYDKIKNDYPIIFLKNKINLGVGNASMTGINKAIEIGSDYIIKMDADGQMNPAYIPSLLWPLLHKKAEHSKGNRFWDFDALKTMPLKRRIGNLFLSFLTKAATGYWDNFDPTNGYFALSKKTFIKINQNNISDRFFFETSLLCELYFTRARIANIHMPAIYKNEKSNLKISKIIYEFPRKLLYKFLRRILLSYFIYDFNVGTVYLLSSFLNITFSLIYGGINWYSYSIKALPAPTGTIMLAVIPFILGSQLGLQFVNYDIEKGPRIVENN